MAGFLPDDRDSGTALGRQVAPVSFKVLAAAPNPKLANYALRITQRGAYSAYSKYVSLRSDCQWNAAALPEGTAPTIKAIFRARNEDSSHATAGLPDSTWPSGPDGLLHCADTSYGPQ
ncbi:hypothetical protein GCM10009712_30070 [Pseudarthrobacter sulfonivorans]